MAIRSRIETFDRDVELILSSALSPQARSQKLADYAKRELAKAETRNKRALGYVPPHETFVDGRQGAPVETVQPDGTVIYEFSLIETALEVIAQMLIKASPVLKGDYRASIALYADGDEVPPGARPPPASEYSFVSSVPYARKIERGLSNQAPDGVFEVVAALASRRFGNIARIRFGYRSVDGGAIGGWAQTASARSLARRVRKGRESGHTEWLTRQPAIIITTGR
jgi:hypothetical protein